MKDINERMEELRVDRVTRLAALETNTIAMRTAAAQAHKDGQTGYRIAKLLGVTTRTVYLWLNR